MSSSERTGDTHSKDEDGQPVSSSERSRDNDQKTIVLTEVGGVSRDKDDGKFPSRQNTANDGVRRDKDDDKCASRQNTANDAVGRRKDDARRLPPSRIDCIDWSGTGLMICEHKHRCKDEKKGGDDDGDETSVNWDNITGKPDFATVATTGSYKDLKDKPSSPGLEEIDPTVPDWAKRQEPCASATDVEKILYIDSE